MSVSPAVRTLLASFAYRSRVETVLDRAKREFGLQATEIVVLLLLGTESANITEISRAVALRRNGVSILVERLRARGLVERHRDGSDRRVANVTLSEAGRDVSARLDRYLDEPLEALLGTLSDGERTQLLSLIDRLATSPNAT